MSFCKTDTGDDKDKVIFLTEEDAKKPSSVELSSEDGKDDDKPQGLITEDGSINWNCPCLGGMAVGPCGVEFREAFSCFHYSEAEPKGADCIDKFAAMQDCMKEYPDLYPDNNDDKKQEADVKKATEEESEAATTTSQEQTEDTSNKAEEPRAKKIFSYARA